jgi:hypothetical protein
MSGQALASGITNSGDDLRTGWYPDESSITFTVTNTGGTAVEVTKSKPPSGGSFTATTSLPEGTTIAAGESLTEAVTFTPSATGNASGVWLLNGNDTTGLHEVKFSGVGILTGSAGAPGALQIAGETNYGQTLVQQPAQGALPSLESKAIPDVKLTGSFVASPSGTLIVKLSCPVAESSCAGTITLRTLAAVRAASHGSKTHKAAILTLAHGSFTVAGGQTASLRMHLSAAARALLARMHVLRASVTILARDPAGTTHDARTTVTIRAAKATHGIKG